MNLFSKTGDLTDKKIYTAKNTRAITTKEDHSILVCTCMKYIPPDVHEDVLQILSISTSSKREQSQPSSENY
jgi:hypothetical protein